MATGNHGGGRLHPLAANMDYCMGKFKSARRTAVKLTPAEVITMGNDMGDAMIVAESRLVDLWWRTYGRYPAWSWLEEVHDDDGPHGFGICVGDEKPPGIDDLWVKSLACLNAAPADA